MSQISLYRYLLETGRVLLHDRSRPFAKTNKSRPPTSAGRAVLMKVSEMLAGLKPPGSARVTVRRRPERPAGKLCSARRRTPHARTRMLPKPENP